MNRRIAGSSGSAGDGPGPVRFGIALLLFIIVAIGSTMYSVSLFNKAKDARIAEADSDRPQVDSIYSDRLESQYDADYDRSRYQEIARSFEEDPVWIDDYLAFEMRDEDIAAIHDEVDASDPPLYVAFLAATELDDTDGQADLLANRIIAEVPDEEATVLVIASNREAVANKGISRDIDRRPGPVDDDSLSQTGLSFVRALAAAPVEEEDFGYGASFDPSGNPIVVHEEDEEDPRTLRYTTGSAVGGAGIGLIIGGGLAVGGVLGVRSRRRRRQFPEDGLPQTQQQRK